MAATHDIDWPAVLVPHLDLPMRRHGVRHSSRQEVAGFAWRRCSAVIPVPGSRRDRPRA
jgi:hypothetical protein